jgi:beta-lactamase class A
VQHLNALKTRLEQLVAEADHHHVTLGISLRDLTRPRIGQALDVGASGPFKAASTIKLGLAALIMHGVDEGRWTLDTGVVVRTADIAGGNGTLQHETSDTYPRTITLDRLTRLMITVSDNTATNVLIDFVGGPASVNRFTHGQGLSDTGFHFGRKMMLPHAPEQENLVRPAELTQLLVQIFDASFLSKAAASQIISWLRQQQVDTKFRAVIPADDLAHKTGELDDVSHDIGYLLVPGRETALSVLSSFDPADFPQGQGSVTADRQVQKVATVVYDQLRRPDVQDG